MMCCILKVTLIYSIFFINLQRSQIQLKRFWENRKAKIKRGLHKLLTANNEIAKASSNPIDVKLFDFTTPILKTPPTPVDGPLFDFSNDSLKFTTSRITPQHIDSANFSIVSKEKNKLLEFKGMLCFIGYMLFLISYINIIYVCASASFCVVYDIDDVIGLFEGLHYM